MHIVIDIGGTKTRIGFSEDLNSFAEIKRYDTPEDLESLQNLILTETEKHDIESVRIGIASTIAKETNTIITDRNIGYIKGLKPEDIYTPGGKISMNNDTELAALGEYFYGDWEKKPNIMAYITLSTGVGGSRLINGKLDETPHNYEPGRMIINKEGQEKDPSGGVGTFEAYCSGIGFLNIYGQNPQDCKDSSIWARYSRDLAVGLTNISLIWAPDVIVIGGGLSQKADLFIDSTVRKMATLSSDLKIPEIKISKLGDRNGLLGGLGAAPTKER